MRLAYALDWLVLTLSTVYFATMWTRSVVDVVRIALANRRIKAVLAKPTMKEAA